MRVLEGERAAPAVDERIRREARVVGLRDVQGPSLESVERRRMQLWVLTSVLLVGVSAGFALLTMLPDDARFASPNALRIGVVLLTIGFCGYAIEKELHLRKLSRMLVDERVLSTALSNRLHEVSLLLDAGKAINSVLELGSVLDVILRSAMDLLDGKSGSIMLVEGDELVAASVRGNEAAQGARLPIGDGIAGRVAMTRDALLINGAPDPTEFPGLGSRIETVDSSLSVPLMNRAELLGVLNVNAIGQREFSEYELRALSLFAEQAAAAIANARLYEAERSHVSQLLELDRMKNEFVARVTHELRTPLTSIIAAAQTAQRPERFDEQPEVVAIIERQAQRLSGMVEELLTASRLEQQDTMPPLQHVDLAGLVRVAARDFAIAGMGVGVDAPRAVEVMGDPDSLRRVIDNLVENAFKYGKPPVTVRVEHHSTTRVVLSVTDRGAGIPESDRERVFDKFYRLPQGGDRPGLGLGLPIVRGLVGACRGTVWVEADPSGGAAFRVELGVAEPRQEAS
ncbi:MAG: GAF domain-containing sensor histidine kinase [Actinomycetota bacterium]